MSTPTTISNIEDKNSDVKKRKEKKTIPNLTYDRMQSQSQCFSSVSVPNTNQIGHCLFVRCFRFVLSDTLKGEKHQSPI